MVPTNNIYDRVFNVAVGTKTGTAFTVDVEGKQYFVTARHVVEDVIKGLMYSHG